MKKCPKCGRDYNDPTLSFCLDDGAALLDGPAFLDGPEIAMVPGRASTSESPTRTFSPSHESAETAILPGGPKDGGPQTGSKRNTVIATVIGIALVIALGFGSYWMYGGESSEQINSIAVMPFQNDSTSVDSEYLSDGLVESLIYRLSKIQDLKVSPTSSVFRYKGKQTDLVTTGNELEVQAVMTGRIAERGENLIISVELVDVRNNKTLWGERYNRKMADLLATQQEITGEIVQNLRLKLAGEEEKGLRKAYTTSSEAYELYLKGRFHYEKRTKADIEKGIDYYQEALDLDPDFALAYVGIANAYQVLPSYGYKAPNDVAPKAMDAARKAMEIDPNLAEAHAAVANIAAGLFWDWKTAEREFENALELNPNDATARVRYSSSYLMPMGRTREAVSQADRALDLEPLSIVIGSTLADTYLHNGQIDEALEQIRATENLQPGHPTSAYLLMVIYATKGMYKKALELAEARLIEAPNDQDSLSIAGFVYAKQGKRKKALEIIGRFRDISENQYVLNSHVAQIYGALGESEQAFEKLERAYAEKDFFIPRMRTNPMLEDLRDDRRFDAIAKRVGLPDRTEDEKKSNE